MRDEDKVGSLETCLDRRVFLGGVALAGSLFAACGLSEKPNGSSHSGNPIQPGPRVAPDGAPLKAGLVGCGGRGTGAALNFLEAGPNLHIAALADVFQDRIDRCRDSLHEEAEVEIPDEMCLLGLDGYQKLIDSGVDVVLLATPPHFRPEHFAAVVEARRHVFVEKPMGVDPVGVRSVMKTAEKADAFGLCVATGTQRRHQRSYIETYNRVVDGAIGQIVSARCYFMGRQLWYKEREEKWSDMEYMLRDWVSCRWLSGDHIVEQHVHSIDDVNRFVGSHPVKAVGMGGRARRVTGDQYDFFSIDFEMENGVHVHSMCRQIDGCATNNSEWVIGTKGYANCRNTIYDLSGNVVWTYEKEENEISPYVQEHIDWVTAIRTGATLNEAYDTADSTMTAIMGRESAYTGQEVTWDQMMDSDQRLGPTEYAMGPVEIEAIVPVPGQDLVRES